MRCARAGPHLSLSRRRCGAELLAVVAEPARAQTDPLDGPRSRGHRRACRRRSRAFMARAGLAAARRARSSACTARPSTIGREERFTRQLGIGARVAATARHRHGEPLPPRRRRLGRRGRAVRAALSPRAGARTRQPLMVLNLGGVGNVTYLDGDDASSPSTPARRARFSTTSCCAGAASPTTQTGRSPPPARADPRLVAAFMDNPFFDRPAPKSLDRQDFHARAQSVEALPDADGAATLAAFTVAVGRRRAAPRAAASRRAGSSPAAAAATRISCAACASVLGVPVDPVESGRLGRRFPRGAVLRLSRRALGARPAPEPADHHRRAEADARRRTAPGRMTRSRSSASTASR